MTKRTSDMLSHDVEILEGIQKRTREVLHRVFAKEYRTAILLDFPRHRNAGDSLIWAGEKSYLKSLGTAVTYTSDADRFNPQVYQRERQGAAVLFHGGGNLGDLWPRYQLFRERVVEQSQGTKVVVLSQSLLFSDPRNAARANRVFAEHGDVTVLLRDRQSLERGRVALPDVELEYCPDMAFGNSPFTRPKEPSHDYLVTVRGDQERAASEAPSLPGALGPLDWGTGMAKWRTALYWASRVPGIVHRRLPTALKPAVEKATQSSNDWICDINVSSAKALLSKGRVLVTDRLHAHVFALLMGVPHVVLDNNYGKIGAIFNEYSGAFSTGRLVTSVSEQELAARQLLERFHAGS